MIALDTTNTIDNQNLTAMAEKKLIEKKHLLNATTSTTTSTTLALDYISHLPAPILVSIFNKLIPIQVLVLSELSRKFYDFIVMGPEMNEYFWYRLCKQEQLAQKKREAWYKEKRLEQELKSVQMMRSMSASSTTSNGSGYGSGYGPEGYEDSPAVSKMAMRQNRKKTGGADSPIPVARMKVMTRTDKKKNWCKIYVDTVIKDDDTTLAESLGNVTMGPAKKPTKFQTVVLNASLPDPESLLPPADSRAAQTLAKVESRAHYKAIRSKPKGKKPSQPGSSLGPRIEQSRPWAEPEWSPEYQEELEAY